jgi:hypothetical protein
MFNNLSFFDFNKLEFIYFLFLSFIERYLCSFNIYLTTLFWVGIIFLLRRALSLEEYLCVPFSTVDTVSIPDCENVETSQVQGGCGGWEGSSTEEIPWLK